MLFLKRSLFIFYICLFSISCSVKENISNIGVFDLLVKKGADINVKDSDGNTLLILASKSSNIAIVQLLIDSKVDVNAKNNEGKTALS